MKTCKHTNLGQLSLSLPGPVQWMAVAGMELARDVARDADAGGSSADIGSGASSNVRHGVSRHHGAAVVR